MTYSDKKSVYEGRFLLNRSCNFDIKLTTYQPFEYWFEDHIICQKAL